MKKDNKPIGQIVVVNCDGVQFVGQLRGEKTITALISDKYPILLYKAGMIMVNRQLTMNGIAKLALITSISFSEGPQTIRIVKPGFYYIPDKDLNEEEATAIKKEYQNFLEGKKADPNVLIADPRMLTMMGGKPR